MIPIRVYTHRQRPELRAQLDTFGPVWLAFIFHDAVAARHYHHTTTTFADCTLYVCDASDTAVAGVTAVPVAAGWPAALPAGQHDHDRRGHPRCRLKTSV